MARFAIGSSLKMYFGHQRTMDRVRAVADICTHRPATTEGNRAVLRHPDLPEHPRSGRAGPPRRNHGGAQELHGEDAGPFTGEVSGPELAELGATIVEIGHAERRAQFGDTDEIVARKTIAALRNGLAPVLCIGEPEHATPQQAISLCIRQLESALAPARAADVGGRLLVAYVPIWAIGAAQPAAPGYVTTICRALREHLGGDELLPDSHVIYGGIAGPGLLPQIAADVDGMFLGRFAHNPDALRLILDEVLKLHDARSIEGARR